MPARIPRRGEVWWVNFGMAAKVRPAVVMSAAYADDDRALIGIIPHTTAARGSQYEAVVDVRFLKPGAFMVQGFVNFPPVNFINCIGTLTDAQMQPIEDTLRRWLAL